MSNKIWHSAKYDPPKHSSYHSNNGTTFFLVYTKGGYYLTAICIYNVHTNEYQWRDVKNDLHTLDDVEYWTETPKAPCKENIATVQLNKDELMEIVEKINSASGIPEEVLKVLGIGGKKEKEK
jgi:hypothetical protein